MSSTPPLRRDWFKSSFSASSNNCVEVQFSAEVVLVRDSKDVADPDGRQPTITIPHASWTAFLSAAVQRGPASIADVVAIQPTCDDGIALCAPDNTTLTYTSGEWDAFTRGIDAGEFSLLVEAGRV
ncbi:DUF397 domain-containing protein [Nocardia cyriacigeorgica]|nr:DUF397 domain-containing protein [Nocardia cyriacigeorgica]